MVPIKTLIFSPETFNLAETTRAIEVAKKCRNNFTCLFTGYSTRYAYLIKEAGFTFLHLKPHLTDRDVTQIMNVDQMKGIRHPFTYSMLKERVANEKQIIDYYKPAAVVIGTTLSMIISARACDTPLVYIKPLAYTRSYFLQGRLQLPPILDHSFLPKKRMKDTIRAIALRVTYKPRAFARIAKEERVTLPTVTIDALDADLNLITTLPEISGVKTLPDNYAYIGPVFAKLESDIPASLYALPKERPVIYFAMGSSGGKDMMIAILRVLEQLPVTVICPMKSIIGQENEFNDNIYLYDLLPAHQLASFIDVSIIHGGEGTVQTACHTGKPFIAIGLQQEQRANIHDCVVFGNALSFTKKDINVNRMEELLLFALKDRIINNRAQDMQKLVENVDGPGNAARHLIEKFG